MTTKQHGQDIYTQEKKTRKEKDKKPLVTALGKGNNNER